MISPAPCAENTAERVCEMCFSVLDLSDTHRLAQAGLVLTFRKEELVNSYSV